MEGYTDAGIQSVVVAVTWASGARLAHDEAAAALCAVTDGV